MNEFFCFYFTYGLILYVVYCVVSMLTFFFSVHNGKSPQKIGRYFKVVFVNYWIFEVIYFSQHQQQMQPKRLM